MSRRPCTTRRRSESPVSTSWHSARIGAHLVHVARREVAEVARIEQRTQVGGHGASVLLTSGDLGSADMRARHATHPPSRGHRAGAGPVAPPPAADPTTAPAAARRSTPSSRSGAEDSLKFDEDSYETDAGCVEVTYTNDGSTAHNLLIEGKSGFKLSVGDVDTGTVELAAGNYELYCDLAGHEAAGMVRRPRGRR